MENERKCLVFGDSKVRQICVGHEYVEIKEFVKRKEKKKPTESIDVNAVAFMDYVGHENGKHESMMNGNDNNALAVTLNDGTQDAYTHYVSVYEFIYDPQNH